MSLLHCGIIDLQHCFSVTEWKGTPNSGHLFILEQPLTMHAYLRFQFDIMTCFKLIFSVLEFITT